MAAPGYSPIHDAGAIRWRLIRGENQRPQSANVRASIAST
jgi:hypothetical protein